MIPSRVVWVAASLLVACSASPAADIGVNEGAARKSTEVQIEERVSVPISEISGLGLREFGGMLEILAVGDQSAKIAVASSDDLKFQLRDTPAP